MTRSILTITTLLSLALPAVGQDNEEGRGNEGPGAEHALRATTDQFLATSGEELYMTACAGCHQPQGQGALGAARYPPLAANPRLERMRYPTWIVLHGMGAMPAFGDWLSDEQVAEVVAYIQQNLGNRYDSAVTPEGVADLRDARGP